jgi:hypothetical protein
MRTGMMGTSSVPTNFGKQEEYFDDVQVLPNQMLKKTEKPEPLKRVRVLEPFGVAHDGTAYFPGDIPEIPASIADSWLRSRWVIEAESE